ncbi:MAG: sensor histidine kinase [Nitrospinaceae bacterium]
MSKLRTIFHPIFVFIGVQIAWIILMAFWINWYLKNREGFQVLAHRFKPELFSPDLNWAVLVEGCFLMILILGGVYVIFVFWNKQARLNQLQSNFVSSVSHELKSPLASIQLYLETLKYHKVSPEESRDFVETMLLDTERLSSLIENILQASYVDPRKMKKEIHVVDLKAFLKEVADRYQRQFDERGCKIKLNLDDAPALKMDERSMRMVFNNLIGNALRYSPMNTVLTIGLTRLGNYCQISFKDEGFGLSERDRKRVFRKFYRVHNPDTHNIPGAGLGLFISREIVKSHGGKIAVTSEGKGRGCTFTVSLPVGGPDKKPWWAALGMFKGIYGKKEQTNFAG